MPKIEPFEKHTARYDEWFETNRFAYQSELRALSTMVPRHGVGIEIGVGTGRFATPLGIKVGVEPSRAMGAVAQRRGIEVVQAVAEALPFANQRFDFALMVATLCFLDNVGVSLNEAYRVLTRGSPLIVGFIDRVSPLGQIYQRRKHESLFYREARFYSVDEVVSFMADAGFERLGFAQTICETPRRIQAPEPVLPGYGKGLFVVLKGLKPADSSP